MTTAGQGKVLHFVCTAHLSECTCTTKSRNNNNNNNRRTNTVSKGRWTKRQYRRKGMNVDSASTLLYNKEQRDCSFGRHSRLGQDIAFNEAHIYREDRPEHSISTHPTSHVGLKLAGTTLSLRTRPWLSTVLGSLFATALLVPVVAAAMPVFFTPRRPSAAWHVMVDLPKRPTRTARKENTFMIGWL